MGIQFCIEIPDITEEMLRNSIVIEIPNAGGSIRYYSAQEIEEYLKKKGFEKDGIYFVKKKGDIEFVVENWGRRYFDLLYKGRKMAYVDAESGELVLRPMIVMDFLRKKKTRKLIEVLKELLMLYYDVATMKYREDRETLIIATRKLEEIEKQLEKEEVRML